MSCRFVMVHSMWFFCSLLLFFFKQKTAYEMRISDWSSDVCSSDLGLQTFLPRSGRAFSPLPIRRPLHAAWFPARASPRHCRPFAHLTGKSACLLYHIADWPEIGRAHV